MKQIKLLNPSRLLLLAALCALLAAPGCSLHSVVDQWRFSSPKRTVQAFTQAADADEAARCFPSSWPLAARQAFFGRLGQWTEQHIVSVKPTVFTGERMSVYDGASVVIVKEDQEVVQDLLDAKGKKQRYWYLLRDCDGQWKIIALFRNSE